MNGQKQGGRCIAWRKHWAIWVVLGAWALQGGIYWAMNHLPHASAAEDQDARPRRWILSNYSEEELERLHTLGEELRLELQRRRSSEELPEPPSKTWHSVRLDTERD